MNKEKLYDIIIIGSGPAGYTAAIYASRGNVKTLLFSGKEPGGQLMITTDVENYPGFEDGIQGPELMQKMKKQAEKFGTEIIEKQITKIDFKKKILHVFCGDQKYLSKTMIVATGASAQWLGLESEKKFKGKGISACATCDGYFFKEKDIVVVGGGDSALEEAIFLTKYVRSVKILVRRDKLRASAIMEERAKKNKKIEFLWNTEVIEFIGNQTLNSVKIIKNTTKQESLLKVQGAFIAIGHVPNTQLFQNHLEMDERGYIVRKSRSQTSVENVFVSGDVHDNHYRQAVTAAGYGCEAALDALLHLEVM